MPLRSILRSSPFVLRHRGLLASASARAALLALAVAAAGCDGEPLLPRLGADASIVAGCVGVAPPAEAWSAEPGPLRDPVDGSAPDGGVDPGPSLGSTAPEWRLRDFQPDSCGFDATYGLEAFRGHVTVAALLAGS